MRECLKKNKVYFETIGWLSLTVMSVLISIAGVAIQKQQTSLMRATIAPQFKFSDSRIPGTTTDEFTVENVGGNVTDEQASLIYFEDRNGRKVKINGVFFTESANENERGKIVFECAGDWYDALQLNHLNINDRIYMEINYLNRAEERQTQTYLMGRVGQFPTTDFRPFAIEEKCDLSHVIQRGSSPNMNGRDNYLNSIYSEYQKQINNIKATN